MTLYPVAQGHGRNQSAAVTRAHRIARISAIEAFIIIMVFVAVALARGYTLGMS